MRNALRYRKEGDMFGQEAIQKIYGAIGDEVSKRIFASRLLYSLTGDFSQMAWMAEDYEKRVEADERLLSLKSKILEMKEKPYIFGAGVYGKLLFEKTGAGKVWEGFIDNELTGGVLGVPVITPEMAAAEGSKRSIVISSKYFLEEMRMQLAALGIEEARIIDGTALYDAIEGWQYFDLPYLEYGDGEVFVDGGCFDGITSKNFSYACAGRYEKIYCFEPDCKNIPNLKRRLVAGGVERYELIDMALWNVCEELSFAGYGNTSSHVAAREENVTNNIKGIPLDEVLEGKKATFIKMDIEGAEKNALKGAKHTIVRYKPKLAIAAYHKPEDIWELPELILKMRPDYKLYFRHYSAGWIETVLYAI